MTLHNYEIYCSVLFFLVVKIVSYTAVHYRLSMFNKPGSVLSSIPEKNEVEVRRWVPRNKHDVLKAKYKCLKKLFQIYDASVIGILPEPCENHGTEDETRPKTKRRSHRTKMMTDACAGTAETTCGDLGEVAEVSENDIPDKASTIATAVMRDLKMTQCSCTSTQMDSVTTMNGRHDKTNSRYLSRSNLSDKESEGIHISDGVFQHPLPYYVVNEKPKLSRFQWFIQRLFGIRQERSHKNILYSNGHVYAASDSNIIPHDGKRKRRGLRFRKLCKPRKIQSDIDLRVRNPMILSCVQSVQKSCLMDTTPRQCPIVGCRMIFYGIINYNDHLNLCHFTERQYVCHYCHEGFQTDHDKCLHENEHIGISKLNSSLASSSRQQKTVSVTQTDPELNRDVPEDKLKKIVSFFDKISNPEQMLSEMKKNRYSESNLRSSQDTESAVSDNSMNFKKGKRVASASSGLVPSAHICHFCRETFPHTRELNLHMDVEHGIHNKFSKFHSCAGLVNPTRRVLDDTTTYKVKPPKENLRRKSEESLKYEPSTNIVYYTSMESMNAENARPYYKWEPATKIIRV